MALTNNNIYPVNGRRLTGADMIPIFGSFINDDREEQDKLVYAINTGKVIRDASVIKDNTNTPVRYNYGTEKEPEWDVSIIKKVKEFSGVDINFVSANNHDSSLFKYNIGNSNTLFYDERGGDGGNAIQQLFEKQGYMYNGWNYLDASKGENINMIKDREAFDRSVVLFPELSIKKKTTDSDWSGYGIFNISTNILDKAEDIKNTINGWSNSVDINTVVNKLKNNIIYNSWLKNSTTYYKNETILSSFQHTLDQEHALRQ